MRRPPMLTRHDSQVFDHVDLCLLIAILEKQRHASETERGVAVPTGGLGHALWLDGRCAASIALVQRNRTRILLIVGGDWPGGRSCA